MGKKAKWFGAVKKVFSPEKKDQKSKKKSPNSPQRQPDPSPSTSLENNVVDSAPVPVPQIEEIKLEETIIEQGKNASSAGASAPSATAVAALEVVRVSVPAKFAGKSREEIAAIKIQTAFRGYMARRALRALRGLVRLKELIDGNSVKRQAASTLRCMQTLARVQSQIRTRRLRMTEENQALQRQLLLKKELDSLQMGEEWDDSTQSKEQIEASIVSKQEATIRRERALAYAFSHQWKNNSRTANPMFIDPSNPQWGWSWIERWMAAKPWETSARSASATDKDIDKDKDRDDLSSVKTAQTTGEGEITRSYARRDSTPKSDNNHSNATPVTKPSPSTPRPIPRPSPPLKAKSVTPKGGLGTQDDDSRSMVSTRSELPRRHSLPSPAVARDDDSLSISSAAAVPSYMAPTKSARARFSRFSTESPGEKVETPEKRGSLGPTKKRLSFTNSASSSPVAARRHSGPPKVEVASNGN